MAAGVTLGFDQAPPTAQLGFAVVQANALFLSATGGTALPQAATPTFSPAAGSYIGTQTVTISDSTTGSSIYLTTDGTTPTYPITGSTRLYASPITVSASETVKAIAVATGYLNSSVSSASYVISGSANSVSIGVNSISYYDGQLAFIDISKQFGNNNNDSTWISNLNDSQAYLPLDSNGMPTSMTGLGGTTYSYYQAIFGTNIPVGTPGQSQAYQPGTYRIQFTGPGTLTFSGDAQVLTTLPSGATGTSGVNYNTLTFTNGGTGTFTGYFQVTNPSNAGITVLLSGISPSAYISGWKLNNVLYSTQLDSGAEMWHPYFKQAFKNIKRIRFMDYVQVINSEYSSALNLSSGYTASSTAGVLQTAWPKSSVSLGVIVGNSGANTAQSMYWTLTQGSTAVNYNGGSVAATLNNSGGVSSNATFAGRCLSGSNSSGVFPFAASRVPSTYSSFSTIHGGSYESCCRLGIELGCDIHIPIPSYADATWAAAFAQLIWNGVGSTDTNFTGIAGKGIKCFIEVGNEPWNFNFPFYHQWTLQGNAQFSGAGQPAYLTYISGLLFTAMANSLGQSVWNANFVGLENQQYASPPSFPEYNTTTVAPSGLAALNINAVCIAPYEPGSEYGFWDTNTFTASTTNGSNQITVTSGSLTTVTVGSLLTCVGYIPTNPSAALTDSSMTTITGISGNVITMSQNATASGTGLTVYADPNYMLFTQSDGGVAAMFALSLSNTWNGVTWYRGGKSSQVGAANGNGSTFVGYGWMGMAEAKVIQYLGYMASSTVEQLYCYEGGNSLKFTYYTLGPWGTGSALYAAQQSLDAAFNIAPQWTTAMGQYLGALANGGMNGSVGYPGLYLAVTGGDFGLIQTVMQLVDSSGNFLPLTSTPPRWQGLQNYIG